ncbi:hypothetical protein GGR53DRAFT_465854 [Hypoxylon sp. FL1150]|nr:hypothetical protein GGR53DRAFT_465854 [Hypoxylon sp. FL1150]
MSTRSRKNCSHDVLQLKPSAYAEKTGYERPSIDQRSDATLETLPSDAPSTLAHRRRVDAGRSETFPAPLVLPNDELAIDPDYEPQSLRSWVCEEERNKPSMKRKTLYVAAVPEISSDVGFMRNWLQPRLKTSARSSTTWKLTAPPLEGFIEYLNAFYYGMSVKAAPSLRFISWDKPEDAPASKKPSKNIKHVGLVVGDDCTRIRARPSPDGIFEGQLNLEDILDCAIELLPKDAYAMILLVDHDLYEDDEDDFCCGRAYGGSRVAVVSIARYHPILDDYFEIDFTHVWPASHCKAYVDGICAVDLQVEDETSRAAETAGPLRVAFNAVKDLKKPTTKKEREDLRFSRVAKTVVHELGHCFGMDHCVYYACIMQGTANMAEDLRQPPYLCPVCLSKISLAIACEATGLREESDIAKYERKRYRALADFCDSRREVGMFAGYGAWLNQRLEYLP